jgi:hypothetical protein
VLRAAEQGSHWAGTAAETEDAMADQHPVEPDMVIGREGTVVPARRRSLAPHALVPVLARATTAGPVLAASAVAVTALAAAKAVEKAGHLAVQLAGRNVPPRPLPGRLEVIWIRIDIRWPS